MSLAVDDLNDLSLALQALPAPDLKSLAKTLHLPPNQTRTQLIEAMEKHGKKAGIGTFFTGGKSGAGNMILNRLAF